MRFEKVLTLSKYGYIKYLNTLKEEEMRSLLLEFHDYFNQDMHLIDLIKGGKGQ